MLRITSVLVRVSRPLAAALPGNAAPVQPVLNLAFLGMLSGFAGAQVTIQSWGQDLDGQVSNTPGGAGFTQVAGGQAHSVALRADGSIVSWGADGWGVVSATPGGQGFTQVASGESHSLALLANGSIVAWGWDDFGQVSSAPTGPGFTQVSGGVGHSVALRSDGSIASWGFDSGGQVSNTPGGTGFVQVDAGGHHSVALRVNGSIVAWGTDAQGSISNTPVGAGFLQIAAGYRHSLALRANGSVVSWGRDSEGQVSGTPSGIGFTQIAAGYYHSLALSAGSSIVAWGWDNDAQVSGTPTGIGFTEVAGGAWHSLARNDASWGYAGTAYCFGDGTGAACPCSGFVNPGDGCANSSGVGGSTLIGSGNAGILGDTFQLICSGVPGNLPGLILRGATQLNGGLGSASGDGLLCTSGQVARSQVQVTSGGSTTFTDFQGQPFGQASYGVGVPTNYQFWYRDPANTCTGAGFNFSNAWTVTWLP